MPLTIGPAVANLGITKDQQHTDQLKGVSKEVEQINHQLRHIIYDLKSELTSLKHNQPDGPYDLTKHHDKMLDFQELYNGVMGHVGDKKKPLLDLDNASFYDKLKEVPKGKLEEVIKKLEDTETIHKDRLTDVTQQLYLMGQLFITAMDILNKAAQSHQRGCERLAQNTRSH